jgi:hypothetical protein
MLSQIFALANETVKISGKVLRPDGKPADFASVALVAEHPLGVGETVFLETSCDDKGQFQLQIPRPSDLPAFVIAYKKGFGIGWAKVSLKSHSVCTVNLNRPATLSGTVKPSFGQKVLSIKGLRPVGLFDSPLIPLCFKSIIPQFLRTQTKEEGRFVFKDLPEGCIAALEVNEPPCQIEVPVTEGLEIELPPTSVIKGQVLKRSDKKPLPNVEVVFLPVNFPEPEMPIRPLNVRTITDVNGQFRAAVTIGRWEWLVWLSAKSNGEGEAGWVISSFPKKVVNLSAGETVNITVEAQRPNIVRGWVANAQTRFPLPRLFVEARFAGFRFLCGVPLAPEFFVIAEQLPEGAYELRLPNGVWLLKVADEGWQSESVFVEVFEGSVIEAPTIFARPFPTVTVSVTNEDGKPTKGIIADDTGKAVETDEEGVTVWQISPNRPVRLIAASLDRKSWAMEVVKTGQKEVRLRLLAGAKIKGVLVNALGQPIEGASVSLWAIWDGMEEMVCLLSQKTGKDGQFEFTVPTNAKLQLKAQKGNKQIFSQLLPASSLDFVRLVLR